MTEPQKPEVDVGSRVRVKPGVTDLVCSRIELGGFTGVVAATDGDLCRVDWDSATLAAMPESYRQRWHEDALPADHLWLPATDLEPPG
jgi:hypothetical protein